MLTFKTNTLLPLSNINYSIRNFLSLISLLQDLWVLFHFYENRCRPPGSEVLPEGIVVKSSNLEMRPLWDSNVNNNNLMPSMNLLAMAVGIKQKVVVNQIVQKMNGGILHGVIASCTCLGGTKQNGGLPNVSYIQT